jgi:nucleotide-binding universal stress UspA family protein
MAQQFRPKCDRHGHVVAPSEIPVYDKKSRRTSSGLKPSAPTRRRKIVRKQVVSSVATKSPIEQILVPIDVTCIKVANLEPVLRFTRRVGAKVTFLHCYVTPRSFSFLRGPSALAEVLYHRDMVRSQLLRLQSELRKSVTKSDCCFTSGSLPEEILQASARIKADLIIVPQSLNLISDCWTTAALIDELVRRANCPVLGVPSEKELLQHSKIRRHRSNGWSELNDSFIAGSVELP